MISFRNNIISFLNLYKLNNFEIKDGNQLAHPALPTSFILSAGILDINKVLSSEINNQSNKVLTQTCFRYFDIKPSSPFHFSLFIMGAALYFNKPTRLEVLSVLSNYFVQFLKLSKNNLFLTYFPGGNLLGRKLDEDVEIVKSWKKIGLKSENIIKGNIHTNFWVEGRNTKSLRSGICGTSSEIFYDTGDVKLCKKKKCLGPYCDCARFIEICNIVFPEFKSTSNGLINLNKNVAEVAIGFERVSLITEEKKNIFDLSHIEILSYHLRKHEKRMDFNLHYLIDAVRSIFAILDENIKPSSKGRGHILRQLFRQFYNNLDKLNENEILNLLKDVHDIIKKNPNIIYKRRYEISFNSLIQVFLNEFELYKKLCEK